MITAIEFNSWRVVPRLMILLYGYMFYRVAEWFMALPEPTAPQAAFVSTMVGMAAAFFKFYVDSGASLKELKEVRQ